MEEQGRRAKLLIDGRLLDDGKTFASLNPATGEVVGHAPDATVADAEAAVAAARRAFDTTAWPTEANTTSSSRPSAEPSTRSATSRASSWGSRGFG